MMKFSTHEMTFILIFILGWVGENRGLFTEDLDNILTDGSK